MWRKWWNRSRSVSNAEQRKTIQGAIAILLVAGAALCMWNNSQTPFASLDTQLLADADETILPPAPDSDVGTIATRKFRPLPSPDEAPVTLDQLVIHVDKHGNIDVAGELINTDVFRNLLTTVKEDSTGDVSVLIHANEKCEVSTLQRVVDVCEECLTQYRLRIEDNQSKSKPTKPALANPA